MRGGGAFFYFLFNERPLQKVTNYCKMKNLAASFDWLRMTICTICHGELVEPRLFRFSQFSLKFFIFCYVTDFRRGLYFSFAARSRTCARIGFYSFL